MRGARPYSRGRQGSWLRCLAVVPALASLQASGQGHQPLPQTPSTAQGPASSPAPASTEQAKGGTTQQKFLARENTVTVSVTGLRHALTTGDGNDLVGNSAGISLGLGKIEKLWYARVSADMYLGPYDPIRSGELNSEFIGTGLSVFAGYSAQSLDLRSVEGGYGFAFGAMYSDIVGRGVGRNRFIDRDNQSADALFMNGYNVRITHLALAPAIFFSWFKEGRRQGNAPEDLLTRIEGFEVVLGTALPLYSRYKARFDLIDDNEKVQAQRSENGKLKGHSIFVTLTTYLGI